MDTFERLWWGELPLETTFWKFTVALGFAVNGICTVIAMFLATLDAPSGVILAVFLIPLPYNVLTTVAVWRSAARYEGDRKWADLARMAAVVWAILATML